MFMPKYLHGNIYCVYPIKDLILKCFSYSQIRFENLLDLKYLVKTKNSRSWLKIELNFLQDWQLIAFV